MRRKRRPKACKHDAAIYTWRENHVGPVASQCSPVFGCGATLSLGPSNDDGSSVKVELRSAELDAWYIADDLPVIQETGWSEHEIDGWGAHCSRGDLVGPLADLIRPEFDAGWLACEMTMHEIHEERDAHAWPWDPTRPLAGQYEEWERAAEIEATTPSRHLDGWIGPDKSNLLGHNATSERSCDACSTSDGCDEHRLFMCAICKRTVPWSDGSDDDGPDVCSGCWLAAQSDDTDEHRRAAEPESQGKG